MGGGTWGRGTTRHLDLTVRTVLQRETQWMGLTGVSLFPQQKTGRCGVQGAARGRRAEVLPASPADAADAGAEEQLPGLPPTQHPRCPSSQPGPQGVAPRLTQSACTWIHTHTHTCAHTYTHAHAHTHTRHTVLTTHRTASEAQSGSEMLCQWRQGFASAGSTGQVDREHGTFSSTLAPVTPVPGCPSLPPGFQSVEKPLPEQPSGPSEETQETPGAARRGAGNGPGTEAPPRGRWEKVGVSGRKLPFPLLPSQGLRDSLPVGLCGREHY